MKVYLQIFLFIITTIAIISCEESNQEIVPPTFKGFKVSPAPYYPGDTIEVKLYYANKGSNVYGPKCDWVISDSTELSDAHKSMSYRDYHEIKASIADEYLKCDFVIPKENTANKTIKCRVEISYSNAFTPKEGKSLTNTLEAGYVGRMENSRIASPLYCKFIGNIDLGIIQNPE